MAIVTQKQISEQTVGDKLVAQRELCNQFVIEELNGKVQPHEYSRIVWNFLARGGQGSITVEVYFRPLTTQPASWGNGNFVLCEVFLF